MQLEIGKENKERFYINVAENPNILLTGYAGSGKTNLASLIANKYMQQDDLSEVHYYTKYEHRYVHQLQEAFTDQRVHICCSKAQEIKSLEKHVRNVKNRIKRIDESHNTVILVLDTFSEKLNHMRLTDRKGYDRYINALQYLLLNSREANYKILLVSQRCVNGDLPEVLIPLFNACCMFSNVESDFARLGLLKPDTIRYPRRCGELWVFTNGILSFVKSSKW